MLVRVETVEPMRVAFMRHVGPYDAVGATWQKLYSWAFPRGLAGPKTVAVGVAYDDPDVTPPERLRCDACLVVDQPIEPEGEIAVQQIGGGDYAVARHTGPYDQLGESYARLCGGWLPGSGRELRSAPALEFYRNSPMNTPAASLITDIFLPLENHR
jgi:AraC family transcriptional regulator